MLLYISILTIILSFILLAYNWRLNKNSLYLSAFFIISATYGLTHHFIVDNQSAFWLAIFYAHFSPLWYLIGPLLYFYVKGTLSDKKAFQSPWDYLHFAPALIHLLGIGPYMFKPFSEKMQIAAMIIENMDVMKQIKPNSLYPSVWAFVLRPVLLLGYLLICGYWVWGFASGKNKFKQLPYKQFIITYRWLIILLGTVGLIGLNLLLITLSFWESPMTARLINSAPLYIVSGFAFLIMSLSILIFPQVLYGLPSSTGTVSSKKTGRKKSTPNAVDLNEEDDPFNELALQIKGYLTDQKPYLNPEFSTADIAVALNVPQHHIAYCFNTILKTKFTQKRAELRVAYAQELLKNGMTENLSIDGIGYQSGFSTRSNFYNTFKSETGFTPSEYLDQFR